MSEPAIADLLEDFNRDFVLAALRAALEALRQDIRAGRPLPSLNEEDGRSLFDPAVLAERAVKRARSDARPGLKPLINATGVIVHTNLGRAPLGEAVLGRLAEVGGRYSNLEYSLREGRRGSRFDHMDEAFSELLGRDLRCLVLNNNAAAVLLVLTALARGREVVVSRGELVEIGGAFRIPDVAAAGGARLREVGTTNRTRIGDYEAAISDETALLMKANRSNFRQEGFTESVPREELAELGRARGLPVFEDLGSGCLADLGEIGIHYRDRVQDSVGADLDLVAFSGDKLMGGPQAGILLGSEEWIGRIRRHPLARALRPDKLTLAALEAVLMIYRAGDPWKDVPVLSMMRTSVSALRERSGIVADRLRELLPGCRVSVIDADARVGGGALPEAVIPSVAVRLDLAHPSRLERHLREGDLPVIVRMEDEGILLDLRTVRLEDEEDLLNCLSSAMTSSAISE